MLFAELLPPPPPTFEVSICRILYMRAPTPQLYCTYFTLFTIPAFFFGMLEIYIFLYQCCTVKKISAPFSSVPKTCVSLDVLRAIIIYVLWTCYVCHFASSQNFLTPHKGTAHYNTFILISILYILYMLYCLSLFFMWNKHIVEPIYINEYLFSQIMVVKFRRINLG
jgi:hypothetical protein